MNNDVLKLINPLLFLSVLIQLMTLVLPKLGVRSPLLFEIHEYNGFAFFIIITIHLFLNRWWLKNLSGKSKGKK